MSKTIKRVAAALLALAIVAGAVPADFGVNGKFYSIALADNEDIVDSDNSEETDEPAEESNVFYTVAEFEAAEPGSKPTLVLQENYNGTITITRDDGIIDLNGFTISGYLNLQNRNDMIIVKNGSLGWLDDTPGNCYDYKKPVILINVNVINTAFGGNREFYGLGNTTIRSFARESGEYYPADATGFNTYADPAAREGLVYNGEKQLLIEDSSFKGSLGVVPASDKEQRYFTYYYTRDEQESDTYVAGTTEEGVISKECAPLYATDAGEYTVYYMWDNDGEYEGGIGYNSFTVTIDKAVPEITTVPTAKELTYNGDAQELVTAGITSVGKLSYSLDGENFSEEIPTATAAGKYTVWYKVIGTNNWESTEAESVEVTVDHLYTKHEKADATCTADGAKEVYWNDELGNLFSDGNGKNKIDSSVVIPAKGHDYDTETAVWSWTEKDNGFDADVQFKCRACGDTLNVKADVTSSDNAKCTTYTATAVYEGNTYTDIKEVDHVYTVTVRGGTITEGEKEGYNYEDVIIIKAEDTPAFVGWAIDDTIISHEQTRTLIVTEDVEVEAVYDEDFMLGDINGDGKINVVDISKAAAHVKGVKKLTDIEINRADVNRDGKINVSDITKIAAHVKGKKLI